MEGTIEYIGEHLQYGKWGHIAIIAAFLFSILSGVSYWFSVEGNLESKDQWRKIGRKAFYAHSLSILAVVLILFTMLYNHMYEYFYVWKHSNNIMPLKYILSCFWEGQEGSFLLWIIWHVVLGCIVTLTSKKWEAPVMAVFAVVQMFLVSMLLGIYIPAGPYAGIFIGIVVAFILFLIWHKLSKVEKTTFALSALAIVCILIFKDIPEFKIGSSPFNILMREHETYGKESFFLDPNYLSVFDGNGLNPLLQNYWMTIHPPTLFLGFASTLVPFAYAIAGLWTKKYNEWMTPTLPWIFFGVMSLGTGILMGGAWAYEALSFGGFWAWDPVENASLFPWLTFVGAAHVMMVQRKKGESSFITIVLTMLSFLLVLYSTYLTRSGILGDSSVHSFADGLPGQLLIFLFFFWWIAGNLILIGKSLKSIFGFLCIVFFVLQLYIEESSLGNNILISTFILGTITLFVLGYLKHFPKGKSEEEDASSREFWMFIASLILMISCVVLVVVTSFPAINKITGLERVADNGLYQDYVRYHIVFGSFICLIMGFGLFLKYKKTKSKKFFKDIALSFILTCLITVACMLAFEWDYENETGRIISYSLFFFTSVFGIVANIDYFLRFLKGNIKKSGAPIAHVGFAMIMLGAFISTSQSKVISENTSQYDLEKASNNELNNRENIYLMKGDTLPLKNYHITYYKNYSEGVNTYFDIDYLQKDTVTGKFEKAFTLSPFVQTNEKMGNVVEPATKHFLHKDIYTHLQAYNVSNEFSSEKLVKKNIGDTINLLNGYLKFSKVEEDENKEQFKLDKDDLLWKITLESYNKSGSYLKDIELYFFISKGYGAGVRKTFDHILANIKVKSIVPDQYFEFEIKEKDPREDYLILKAIEFPLINILWVGCIIMIIGTIIAIFNRIKTSKLSTNG